MMAGQLFTYNDSVQKLGTYQSGVPDFFINQTWSLPNQIR